MHQPDARQADSEEERTLHALHLSVLRAEVTRFATEFIQSSLAPSAIPLFALHFLVGLKTSPECSPLRISPHARKKNAPLEKKNCFWVSSDAARDDANAPRNVQRMLSQSGSAPFSPSVASMLFQSTQKESSEKFVRERERRRALSHNTCARLVLWGRHRGVMENWDGKHDTVWRCVCEAAFHKNSIHSTNSETRALCSLCECASFLWRRARDIMQCALCAVLAGRYLQMQCCCAAGY